MVPYQKHPITKTTPLRELINKTAKESDNVTSNLLSYYIANKFDDDFFQVTTAVTGSKWDMVSRETSAQVAGKMMEALYEQNGYVIEKFIIYPI